MSRYFIGLMSGTSLDGVDVAYCDENIDLICAKTYPFDEKLREEVLNAIYNKITIKKLGELDIMLGEFFAKCTQRFIQEFNITSVEAIGSHGQTLWHEPNSNPAFSIQLGNAHTISTKLGIKVVADFRQKDIALGGEGAPLTPAFHNFIFKNIENCGVVNIGGMANITILQERLIGYDTGCGNVLMDICSKRYTNKSFDNNGNLARSGNINQELLHKMLSESFFSKKYPKSTGRELFNDTWLNTMLDGFDTLKASDIQATLLELTTQSIANEVKKHMLKTLIVCGGGAKNTYLLEVLQSKLPLTKVITSDSIGVSSEFLEAMAFAYFAKQRIDGNVIKICSVTNASRDALLGVIYE